MNARAIVVLGPAGSGKSTIAKRLAAATGAAYLDKDAMLTEFVSAVMIRAGRRPQDRESDAFYLEEILPLEYRALWRTAADNLHLGTSVVLDAPFFAYVSDDEYLGRALAEAGAAGTPVDVVHVSTPPELVRSRLHARGNPRDEWKLEHWNEFWEAQGGLQCRWLGARHLTLENGGEVPGDQELRRLLEP